MPGMVIEHGRGYTVESHGNGWAYTITHEATGKSVFIQDEEAGMWRDEYDDLMADHEVNGTRASRFSKRELLDTMLGAYFD